jgi:hypothetical protein
MKGLPVRSYCCEPWALVGARKEIHGRRMPWVQGSGFGVQGSGFGMNLGVGFRV